MQALQDYIQKLMAERGLSKSALAEALGYRSKTSLDRIMSDASRESSLRKFKQAVLAAFPMTPEEKRELNEAVQIGIYGMRQYLLNQQMWKFVRGGSPESAEDLRITAAEDGRTISISERYQAAQNLHITVLNCQYAPALFELLRALLMREDVIVNHYVYVDADSVRTMAAVNALMHVFYMNGYSCFALNTLLREGGAGEPGMNTADVAIFEYTDANGKPCEDVVTFQSPVSGMMATRPAPTGALRRLMGLDSNEYYSIKRIYFNYNELDDYVRFSADYAALEENRAIWKIKPDIGVDQIPVPIMEAALLRGAGTESMDPQFFDVVSMLREVYRKRVANTFNKKKHAHTIMKRGAMRAFAQTGRSTDHFWMMAPYTPEERIQILENLLDQQQNNPYMHIYFLKEDDALRDIEIACYEDTGMLLLESNTDYDLERRHSEVLITLNELLRLFRDFFMRTLVREYVLSETETCRFLQQLIEEIRKNQQPSSAE